VICAAFNEATTLPRVLKELRDAEYKVVVVDDGSSDHTPRIAAATAAAVISHPINLGQGAALKTGIAYALSQGAQFLVTFDADGQHRISDIACLLEALEGADFALGSRFLQGSQQMPLIRHQLLRAATLFTIVTTGLCLTDSHNGLRAFTAVAPLP
jgi:glycosyltransferase involved in cell wall biosynthesis